MKKLLHCFGIAALVLLLCRRVNLHEDKFTGNLVQGQDQSVEGAENVEQVPTSHHSSNLSESGDDSVHLVRPSGDINSVSGNANVPSSQDSGDSQSTLDKEKVKKASRPVKKAESSPLSDKLLLR